MHKKIYGKKIKNILRSFEPENGQKLKNTQAEIQISWSYKKKTCIPYLFFIDPDSLKYRISVNKRHLVKRRHRGQAEVVRDKRAGADFQQRFIRESSGHESDAEALHAERKEAHVREHVTTLLRIDFERFYGHEGEHRLKDAERDTRDHAHDEQKRNAWVFEQFSQNAETANVFTRGAFFRWRLLGSALFRPWRDRMEHHKYA